MNNEQPIYFAPTDKRIYGVLVITGAICAAIIGAVYVVTEPMIEHNKSANIEHAIHAVLPDAHHSLAYALTGTDQFMRIDRNNSETKPHFFVGYDSFNRFVGFAIEAQSQGYQDNIRLLYGYVPQRDMIVGMVVLESRETPGLGDRISKDKDFARNFLALDVSIASDPTQIKHSIEVVKHGTKATPWQIDAITGATVSSRAVGAALNDSTHFWIALLKAHAKEFADGAADGR